MATATSILDSLKAWWQTATPPTRVAAVGGSAMLMAALIFATILASSPNYTVILNGVSGDAAGQIESTLREHSIPMKWSANDETVSVPSADADHAKMYVAGSGTLSKDIKLEGVDPLDKIGLATTTDVEKQRILENTQEEVSRVINQYDGVSAASVLISPGSQSSLFGADNPPTATVSVAMKGDQALDPLQIQGILGTVRGAVSGITNAGINITDGAGHALYEDSGSGANLLGQGQIGEANARYAGDVKSRLQDLLSPFGQDSVRLTVDAELNQDQTQTHSIQHTPTLGMRTGVPLTVSDNNESYTGTGSPASGGVAGSGSNLTVPSYTTGSGSASGGTYKHDNTSTTYADNLTDTVTQKTPGSDIKRLTVSALIDSKVAASDIPKIQAIIATAIGATPGDPTRSVTVAQVPFSTAGENALQKQQRSLMSQDIINNVVRSLAVCVVACTLLVMLFRTGKSGQPVLATSGGGSNIGLLENADEQDLEMLLEERTMRVEDVLAQMPEIQPRRPKRRLQAPSIEAHQDLKMESIQGMIGSNSEGVALLLKGWMAEETKA